MRAWRVSVPRSAAEYEQPAKVHGNGRSPLCTSACRAKCCADVAQTRRNRRAAGFDAREQRGRRAAGVAAGTSIARARARDEGCAMVKPRPTGRAAAGRALRPT